ncbi:MAG: NDP-sugar synthase [Candidatus Margulisiibacteriota bacterium]
MKALIMAAGYGTRLEPLTLAVPKPMIPILNLPTMQHNIELLKRHGIHDIVANIHYHPEQIENYFGDGHAFGVNLSYSYEEKLLGTAGGVKKMGKGLKETFLVLSSDALTDINLGRMLAYHQEKKALITIALARVKDVSGLGVVLQDDDGKITGFQEKPRPEEAKSDLVNTGIYIMEPAVLDLIPEGFYDFGKELFPRLVAEKADLFAYPMVEYWSDVGGLDKYICSNYDALEGRVQIHIPGQRISSATWMGEREAVDPSARFEGVVVIGDRCRIGANVYLKDAVIGDKCVIEEGAVITGSVIWSDVLIENGAQINQSVIGSWCQVGVKAVISEGSIISNRSIIRPSTLVPPGSRIEPNSIL